MIASGTLSSFLPPRAAISRARVDGGESAGAEEGFFGDHVGVAAAEGVDDAAREECVRDELAGLAKSRFLRGADLFEDGLELDKVVGKVHGSLGSQRSSRQPSRYAPKTGSCAGGVTLASGRALRKALRTILEPRSTAPA